MAPAGGGACACIIISDNKLVAPFCLLFRRHRRLRLLLFLHFLEGRLVRPFGFCPPPPPGCLEQVLLVSLHVVNLVRVLVCL